MLLPLITIAAVFIASWMLAVLIEVWVRAAAKSEQLSGLETKKQIPFFPGKKISLWSLIFFLFSPSFLAPPPSNSLPRENY
jgi:hypothetical protein